MLIRLFNKREGVKINGGSQLEKRPELIYNAAEK